MPTLSPPPFFFFALSCPQVKIAIYGSVGVNVLLFFLQLYAAISSKSLSLFATMADSFMDQLSGFILMWAARASAKSNWFKYPSVKKTTTTYTADLYLVA